MSHAKHYAVRVNVIILKKLQNIVDCGQNVVYFVRKVWADGVVIYDDAGCLQAVLSDNVSAEYVRLGADVFCYLRCVV
jgi:hypothetical protein